LIETLEHYFNGFPAKAFASFERVMNILSDTPLKIYQKSVMEQFKNQFGKDDLKLFRVVRVNDNKPYNRGRVFHTPYNLRSKVSSSRYSIAGYPSLYLGTSLELCCEEIHVDPHVDLTIAALFRLERSIEYTSTNIRVIELAIKPQDFLKTGNEQASFRRHIPANMTNDVYVRTAFLLWYPLIAACSFIRVNKSDPFAAEYIIPQLLMQWVRNELEPRSHDDIDQLIGIRYFSCASVKASNMGFNYVFPTSGRQKSYDCPYCSVLAKAFRLTSPVYIKDFNSLHECENFLDGTKSFDFVNS
jgi:hypothetical protein